MCEMKNIYTGILAAIIMTFLVIMGYFVSDIVGIIQLSGFLKLFVYTVSIILIFDILFVLLLVRNATKREKEMKEISKNVAMQMSRVLKIDEGTIKILDEYEFLEVKIEDGDMLRYDANYYIKAGENIYGIRYDYKKAEIIHIQLQDKYVYKRNEKIIVENALT
jgi:hypothetical protein